MRVGAGFLDLQQGEIGLLVCANHGRMQRFAVIRGQGDVGCVLDDVIIGHDIAVRGNDETPNPAAWDECGLP